MRLVTITSSGTTTDSDGALFVIAQGGNVAASLDLHLIAQQELKKILHISACHRGRWKCICNKNRVHSIRKMKLITEEVTNVQVITEGKGANKKLYIEGTFLQGEIKNRNGRMYPISTLAKEVDRYCETFVNKGRALGELGHPDGPTVNLDRVSHKITSLVQEGNNFRGKAQILSTPMGKIASSLLDEGVMLGVSSRGVGSLQTTSEGCKVVGEDFQLATAADIVADPSAPDAFVNGIMEGREWVWEGGILREQLAEQTKKRINTLVDQRQLEEHKLQLWSDFLSNL